MPLSPQLLTELDVIVDFSVVGDPATTVLGRHRLVTKRRQIDNRQSPVPQPDRMAVRPGPRCVREPPHDCKRPLLSPRIQQHVAFPVRSAMRLDENHAFQC